MFIIPTLRLYRLRNQAGITADFCVFVGETLKITCFTDNDERLPLLITSAGGAISSGTATVTNAALVDEGTYSCHLSTDSSQCGGATQNLVVEVFGKQLHSMKCHLIIPSFFS